MRTRVVPASAQLLFRALICTAIWGMQSGAAFASTCTSANYCIFADSIDIGGTQASSSYYSGEGSMGAINGQTSVSVPPETIKSGYVAQLYQITGLQLNASFIDNGTTQQLGATQTLDDGTTLIPIAGSLSWSVVAGQLPAGLILNNSTGIISGLPTGSGAYSFTILVTDGFGNSAQQTFSGNPLSFSDWIAQFPQVTDVSPTATPQHDGVDNLLKYLFDINPSQAMSLTDRGALPAMGIDTTSTPGDQYLSLTYRENLSLENVTVTVQTSFDLKTWTTVNPPNLLQQVGTDSHTGDPIFEIGVLIPPGTPKQFVRLSVTQM